MSTEKVSIITVEPYHDGFDLLIPHLVRRLRDNLEQLGDEINVMVPGFMARFYANDPGVLLLAAVTSKGIIKGHAAASISNNEVNMIQPRLDEPTENDAIKEMLDKIDEWAKKFGHTRIAMHTRRLDAKWSKKYGFEVLRYVLIKEIK